MDNTKPLFTPGPWKVRYLRPDEEEPDFFVEAPKINPKAGYNIEIMGSEDGPNYKYEERQADAHLIAAAPDMFKVLEALSTNLLFSHCFGGSDIFFAAKAAYNKALNKQ